MTNDRSKAGPAASAPESERRLTQAAKGIVVDFRDKMASTPAAPASSPAEAVNYPALMLMVEAITTKGHERNMALKAVAETASRVVRIQTQQGEWICVPLDENDTKAQTLADAINSRRDLPAMKANAEKNRREAEAKALIDMAEGKAATLQACLACEKNGLMKVTVDGADFKVSHVDGDLHAASDRLTKRVINKAADDYRAKKREKTESNPVTAQFNAAMKGVDQVASLEALDRLQKSFAEGSLIAVNVKGAVEPEPMDGIPLSGELVGRIRKKRKELKSKNPQNGSFVKEKVVTASAPTAAKIGVTKPAPAVKTPVTLPAAAKTPVAKPAPAPPKAPAVKRHLNLEIPSYASPERARNIIKQWRDRSEVPHSDIKARLNTIPTGAVEICEIYTGYLNDRLTKVDLGEGKWRVEAKGGTEAKAEDIELATLINAKLGEFGESILPEEESIARILAKIPSANATVIKETGATLVETGYIKQEPDGTYVAIPGVRHGEELATSLNIRIAAIEEESIMGLLVQIPAVSAKDLEEIEAALVKTGYIAERPDGTYVAIPGANHGSELASAVNTRIAAIEKEEADAKVQASMRLVTKRTAELHELVPIVRPHSPKKAGTEHHKARVPAPAGVIPDVRHGKPKVKRYRERENDDNSPKKPAATSAKASEVKPGKVDRRVNLVTSALAKNTKKMTDADLLDHATVLAQEGLMKIRKLTDSSVFTVVAERGLVSGMGNVMTSAALNQSTASLAAELNEEVRVRTLERAKQTENMDEHSLCQLARELCFLKLTGTNDIKFDDMLWKLTPMGGIDAEALGAINDRRALLKQERDAAFSETIRARKEATIKKGKAVIGSGEPFDARNLAAELGKAGVVYFYTERGERPWRVEVALDPTFKAPSMELVEAIKKKHESEVAEAKAKAKKESTLRKISRLAQRN